MRKVVLIVGAGYLASAIAKFISSNGCDVILLVRNPDSVPQDIQNSCLILEADPAQQYLRSLDSLQIDVAIHAAGAPAGISNVSPEAAFSSALNLLVSLVTFFSSKKILFIYLSTIHVYGQLEGTISENTPLSCLHPYGLSHLLSERLTEYFLGQERMIVLRLANIFGASPVMNKNANSLFLNEAIRSCVETREIEIKSDPSTQRIFIPLTWFTYLILKFIEENESFTSERRIFNVGYGRSLSLREISNTVKNIYSEITGQTVNIKYKKDRVYRKNFVIMSGLEDFLLLSTKDLELEIQKSIRGII